MDRSATPWPRSSVLGAATNGHPASGQDLEALFSPPVVFGIMVSVGNTGSMAHKIVTRFSGDPSRPITLTALGASIAVPTDLVLPCGGKDKVTFRPTPFSKSARTSIVTVHDVNPAA